MTTIDHDFGRPYRSGFNFRWLLYAIGALLVLILLLSTVSVTRIGAGQVGVEVNLAGSQRGPADIPVRTGWVFYSPWKTQIIDFPTYVQTVKWTRDVTEGHPLNEEMTFNSKEGCRPIPTSRSPMRSIRDAFRTFM